MFEEPIVSGSALEIVLKGSMISGVNAKAMRPRSMPHSDNKISSFTSPAPTRVV